ncbi:MAG: sodium:proton antiporter NhaD [Desulfobacterales bacterium]|nr:sodium:proton antiporter NhaD [Desulfobacterales bacterium]
METAINLTGTFYGILALFLFIIAYSFVPFENKLHLRKSKPVMLAAGIIWILVALAFTQIGDNHSANEAIKHSLLEYAELFLFLLCAMTYINALEERNIFQALRAALVSRGFSLRMIFWITGLLAFFISPIADNLTTALFMGAVVMTVGGNNKKFISISCVNIIVAANAGGAFSPFGDITTLMVWQKGKVQFTQFFDIFIPSVVNWLVPAIIMNFYVDNEIPKALAEKIKTKYGAYRMMILFLITIAMAVCFHNFLHLPPAAGMMLGLSFLGIFSYHVKRYEGRLLGTYDSMLGIREADGIHPLHILKGRVKTLPQIINEIPIAAFAIDKEHIITHWNKACEELTGIQSSQVIGTKKQWSAFYSKERPVMADLVLDKAPDTEFDKYYEKKLRRSTIIDTAYEATDFFHHMGETGKWIGVSAMPIEDEKGNVAGAIETLQDITSHTNTNTHLDIMKNISRAEWDTLLFFYGVILCVGGLAQFGYLNLVSSFLYKDMGPTIANSLVGIISALIDNIPVMFAVLKMDPSMSLGQWLLVTLTAGTGGSLIAIGSAAGVGLLGTARESYSFGSHLKWTPLIALGYVASIIAHLIINAKIM